MATKLNLLMEKIAEELRGSLSGWDFKQYIFAILFYRFYSQKHDLPTPDESDLAGSLTQIFTDIESSTPEMAGLFHDLDFHSEKLGKSHDSRNRKLAGILKGIDLGSFEDQSTDVFGDAYEYLLGMYARDSRQAGGEFYTPQEVSELLSRIALASGREIKKVYDPTCGSGSLLLKFHGKATHFYGQEVNLTTYNLCRMNMILHGIPFDHFNIAHDDTLSHPRHDDEFDAIVSNPPYSIHWDSEDLKDDSRFSRAGVLAPKSKADLAFVMHILSRLATGGTAAVVCYPGALYRGHSEQKIRQYLIENNFVDAAIGLPKNLFFGTSIDTVILVLKKDRADENILFIDASEQFQRHETQNVMMPSHLDKIMWAYEKRSDETGFSKVVACSEVIEQASKILPSLYVEARKEEEIDIHQVNADFRKVRLKNKLLRERFDEIIQSKMEDFATLGYLPLPDDELLGQREVIRLRSSPIRASEA